MNEAWHLKWSVPERIGFFRKTVGKLGVRGALQRSRARRLGDTYVSTPLSSHPVFVRQGTSDPWVFDQIFIDHEYRCIDHLENVRTIVDAGANVGYSAAYLLSRFPGAHLIAIEPDPENFRAAQVNLSPWPATLVRAALWSHPTTLDFRSNSLGQEYEWGRQVEDSGSGNVRAVDMSSIIRQHGPVDLLKIDIEGAESEVFSGDVSWLDRVRNIVIELHSDEDRKTFFSAIGDRYRISQCEELTVCLS